MQQIHIRTVLAELELPGPDGRPRACSLGYYKTDGTPGTKAAVRKGGQAGGQVGSGKFRYNVKATGTLQLVDCRRDRPFSLKISLLTRFNGARILHA